MPSNVAIMPSNQAALAGHPHRTPAERGFSEAFASALPRLAGTGWVGELRHRAIREFEAAGLPTRRLEEFKYTDLRERLKQAYPPALLTAPAASIDRARVDRALGPLAQLDAVRLVLVDGVFAPALSSLADLGPGTECMPLGPLLAKAPAWLEGKFTPARLGNRNALTALNTAFMTDGILLKIKPGETAPKPVLVVHARASATPQSISTRNIIAIEAGARLTLVEAHVALEGAAPGGFSNTLSDVTVADGGEFHHVSCAAGDAAETHASSWITDIGTNAVYRGFQLTAGPGLVRNGIDVALSGAGSRLDLSGAFLARGTCHVDTTLVVDHKVPDCESRELFKGVLDDRARGVFQGKIIVRPGADKTDGKQMARALLLSEDAEFDSKPELEIYADDVACGHGATAAALDDDLMFYCRSRGIPESEARALLIEAFIGDAVAKVEHDGLREALMDIARGWLFAAVSSPTGGATS